MTKGLVVFSDNTGVWWLKLLKPGFRHCFVILETDRGGIWVDPLSNSFTIKALEGYELKGLIRWYHEMGMRVLNVELEPKNTQPYNWAPMTCVEVVKRLLGLRCNHVWTPWQLYNFLKRTKSEFNRN